MFCHIFDDIWDGGSKLYGLQGKSATTNKTKFQIWTVYKTHNSGDGFFGLPQ